MLSKNELDKIIDNKGIITLFQPIVSLKEKRVAGVEALSRGIHPEKETIISPAILFDSALKYQTNLALDRLCRKSAIERYRRSAYFNNQILFLNFDPAILDQINIGSGWTEKIVRETGVNPRNIGIEIVESKIESKEKLIQFVNLYRSFGFLIVLDDFGAEHSNLNRLEMVKPDIIKIDRELIKNISSDYYKQAIVRSIINLSGKTGSLSLVEGVENADDIIKCHELGADLFQGFYFSKPSDSPKAAVAECSRRITEISVSILSYQSLAAKKKSRMIKTYHKVFDTIINDLLDFKETDVDKCIEAHLNDETNIQCIYLLNEKGIQLSETVCNQKFLIKRAHSLFNPSLKGTDHSLKEYFYQIQNLGLRKFISDPYISLATGEKCRTMSGFFKDRNKHMLCIDFIS